MPSEPAGHHRYQNPLIDSDVPDPDVARLDDGTYLLVASSFDRLPGLPLWRSDDLVNWHPAGFASGGASVAALADGGVWAPSIRVHDGTLHIVWGDPDRGVFETHATNPAGPWSEPELLLPGLGVIDPCPFWDADGRAYLVHGWAKSRAGFHNRLSIIEVSPALDRVLGEGRTLIDGDAIEGCTILEGPKVYAREGEVWVFAPAGGVATGWQYVFRADSIDGAWRHRIVLGQGGTAVNGPHQGAWVELEHNGDTESWFLHFQHRGVYGRVLHLQPMRWDECGWPLFGQAVDGGPAEPVTSWTTPRGGTVAPAPFMFADDFTAEQLDPAWHGRGDLPADLVHSVGGGTLELRAHGDSLLARPIDARLRSVAVVAEPGDAAAALVMDGEHRCLVAAHGSHATVAVDGVVVATAPFAGPALLSADFLGERVQFRVNGVILGPEHPLTERRWTGAEIGLAALGSGTARFSDLQSAVMTPGTPLHSTTAPEGQPV